MDQRLKHKGCYHKTPERKCREESQQLWLYEQFFGYHEESAHTQNSTNGLHQSQKLLHSKINN